MQHSCGYAFVPAGCLSCTAFTHVLLQQMPEDVVASSNAPCMLGPRITKA